MKVLFVVAHIDKTTIKPKYMIQTVSQIFVPATRLHVVLGTCSLSSSDNYPGDQPQASLSLAEIILSNPTSENMKDNIVELQYSYADHCNYMHNLSS